jgi:alpha-tubulin suppressor-like RCC1 family protein
MISSKTIIDKANAKITAGLTEEEVQQLSVIDDSIIKSKLVVDTFGNLPNVADNKGRLVYVSGQNLYYFSDGVEWLSDFSSVIQIIGGTVFSWGQNNYGSLGDGTGSFFALKSSPVTVVGGITDWSAVSANGYHSLGLRANGVLYAWGNGAYGRLGDNTIIPRSSPVTVVGGITDWSQVSAGGFHSLGLRATGVLYAWGNNQLGTVGDGTVIRRSSPVIVVGGITDWRTVAAGNGHSLGIRDNGVLYAWGLGTYGRLGDGTGIRRSSPVTVVGGITDWSQISAGQTHSLGLRATGVLYAWGNNELGTVGDGTVIRRSSPVTVVGGITNWSAVAAGSFHSLGLTDAGVIYAWGASSYGRLGDNTTIDKSSPVTVVGGITNWSAVAAGGHSLGLTNTGVIYAWGLGSSGQLGVGTIISRSSPVTVVGGITNWSVISAGRLHSSAVSTQTKGFNEP